MNTYKFILNPLPSAKSYPDLESYVAAILRWNSEFIETKANNINSAIWNSGLGKGKQNFYLFSVTKP